MFPETTNYFLAIALADVMSVHFFFRVTNEGSWLQIGTSISHFALSNANIVFHLLMMGLSRVVIQQQSSSS
jgi:GPI ethanolamine phosphate transferase 1